MSFAINWGHIAGTLAGTSAARGRWKGGGGCNLPADGTTEVTEVALLGLDYSSLLRLYQALILALPRIVLKRRRPTTAAFVDLQYTLH